MCAMFAALLLSAVFGVQDPEPKKPENTPATPPQQVAAEDWDDARTKAELKDFDKAMKSRTLKDKLAAIARLDAGRNDKLVAPLANVVLRERAITVRKAAAEALAHQPAKQCKPQILRLLGDTRMNDAPEVQGTLVESLARVGYECKRDWEAIGRLFEADYGPERIPLQRAILGIVKDNRELEALDMLVRNLGEPVPENPDDAGNPPAEYWEKRWKSWQVWRGDVKETLLTLTGQRFSTAKEAKDWIAANRSKLEKR